MARSRQDELGKEIERLTALLENQPPTPEILQRIKEIEAEVAALEEAIENKPEPKRPS
jgi:CHASE3 domain sensor protein